MTDDAILRNFLLDAAAVEFSAELSDTTPVDASPRLRRQMTAMLNDPNDWAKRQHRPVWNRLARTAAVILLTCFLSLGALMAISPTVRAAVITRMHEMYEHSVINVTMELWNDSALLATWNGSGADCATASGSYRGVQRGETYTLKAYGTADGRVFTVTPISKKA